MFALISNGKVVHRRGSKFPVSPPLEWIDIGQNLDGVGDGYLWDGRSFTPAPRPAKTDADLAEIEIMANPALRGLIRVLSSGPVPPNETALLAQIKSRA